MTQEELSGFHQTFSRQPLPATCPIGCLSIVATNQQVVDTTAVRWFLNKRSTRLLLPLLRNSQTVSNRSRTHLTVYRNRHNLSKTKWRRQSGALLQDSRGTAQPSKILFLTQAQQHPNKNLWASVKDLQLQPNLAGNFQVPA